MDKPEAASRADAQVATAERPGSSEPTSSMVHAPTGLVPGSVLLQRIGDTMPADHCTLGWLLGRLHKHAFGIVMLLLGVVAMAPGVSIVAGVLLLIPSFQMIRGRMAPRFPRRIALRAWPARRLAVIVQRGIPWMRMLERVIHPRWPVPMVATKRVVGIVVMLLSLALVMTPIPFTNVLPAALISLIALAYLEEDGLVLAFALALSVVALAFAGAAAWNAVGDVRGWVRAW